MPRMLILLALIGIAIIDGIVIFSGLPAQDKRNYTEDEIRVIAKAFLDYMEFHDLFDKEKEMLTPEKREELALQLLKRNRQLDGLISGMTADEHIALDQEVKKQEKEREGKKKPADPVVSAPRRIFSCPRKYLT